MKINYKTHNQQFLIYIKILAFLSIYKFLLEISYSNFVVPYYGYYGFKINEFSLEYTFFSWLILLISSILYFKFNHYKKSPSILIFKILYIISFIPFLAMVNYQSFDNSFIIGNLVYWLFLFIFIFSINSFVLPIRISSQSHTIFSIKIYKLIVNLFILFFVLTILYSSYQYSSLRINLDFYNVYDFRLEARELSMPSLLRYLFTSSRAIIPILIVLALNKKKYFSFILLIIIQLLSYSFDGLKSVLFITVISIIIGVFYQKKLVGKLSFILIISAASFLIFSLVEFFIFNSFSSLEYVVRRVLFLPNLLSSYYFDYFSINPPDLFRRSFFSLLGATSQYNDITFTISSFYMGRFGNANNGLISDAVFNLGILGTVIMPFIFSLILHILDRISVYVDIKVTLIVSFILSYYLISSFLTVVLLTHGFLMMLFFLYFYSKMHRSILNENLR